LRTEDPTTRRWLRANQPICAYLQWLRRLWKRSAARGWQCHPRLLGEQSNASSVGERRPDDLAGNPVFEQRRYHHWGRGPTRRGWITCT
jgi:hypothetical protein